MDRFVRSIDATFGQQIFYVSQGKRISKIYHHGKNGQIVVIA